MKLKHEEHLRDLTAMCQETEREVLDRLIEQEYWKLRHEERVSAGLVSPKPESRMVAWKRSREAFKEWLGFGVYVFWQDEHCLYVNLASIGFSSVFDPKNKVAQECWAMATEFEWHTCATEYEAETLTKVLASRYKPAFKRRSPKPPRK